MTTVAFRWSCGRHRIATHDARASAFMALAPAAHSPDTNADEALIALQECRFCAAFVSLGARLPIRPLSMSPLPNRCAA